MYVCIYIYINICIYVYIFIYAYALGHTRDAYRESLTLCYVSAHCNILQRTATHCSTPQPQNDAFTQATPSLQHTATHGTTLQHTATFLSCRLLPTLRKRPLETAGTRWD